MTGKMTRMAKFIYLIIINLFLFHGAVHGTLAGGRPNTFSGGLNAFAGVVNPANAVWIPDRFDIGAFWVNQKSSITNCDNKPTFPPGKVDFSYKARDLFSADAAIQKHFSLPVGDQTFDATVGFATYTMPSQAKVRTKMPLPLSGTTPIVILNKTEVTSLVFSIKLNPCHSVGCSFDYLYLSHKRNGFQNSDNPLRSVSPGHVTNNGIDHSSGFGLGVGWRWNITDKLTFGAAWTRKNYCGQYRKYRGFEPFHGKNYTPQTVGAGFNYIFNTQFAGRIEMLWSNQGNLPGANNSILPNGAINTNKRGSSKSPGPGLTDATYINVGMGYKVNSMLSVGAGLSHRLKFPRRSSNFLSHSYMRQVIYNVLSFGANYTRDNHDLFMSCSLGLKNKTSGYLPAVIGGGRFTSEKQNITLSLSWGYKY